MSIEISSVQSLLSRGVDRAWLIESFVRINAEAWPPPVPEDYLWTPRKMESQFATCPHLLFCARNASGKVLGTLCIIHTTTARALSTTSWLETSAYGMLTTHDDAGDCAFGLDLSVPKGAKAGDQLIEAGILHAVIEPNKKGVYLGARMPRYHKFAHRMTPEDFIGLNGGKNQDPEIRLYLSAGFKIIRVIPGYMQDPDSCDNGVLMFWENPDYQS